MLGRDYEASGELWLREAISELTDCMRITTPIEWAETNRYLPLGVTPLPGLYSYEVCPYLKEIVSCLDIRSPVREVTLMKGAQIGATSGVLENAIGYYISQVRSAPMMLLTADKELAKIRMDKHITIMIQQSNLAHLIKSSDEISRNKTGKTNDMLEWIGGGYLLPFGARSASKLRSSPIQILLEDEVDGYPDTVGNDGDPMKLAEARTNSYAQTRKILRLSTPLLKYKSRIERKYKEGDQRKFLVPCRNCGIPQELRFSQSTEEKKAGKIYGLVWETTPAGALKADTVRYKCKHCGHLHSNADKVWLLPRGRWVPTATPLSEDTRSYHLNALYAPAGMYSWANIVRSYLTAWDTNLGQVKNINALQEFYNNDLGLTFENRGEKVRFITVSGLRRNFYKFGDIPNAMALLYSGSRILAVTCSVDVHKANLSVAVFGWTRGRRCYLLDYWIFEGHSEDEGDEGTWGKLQKLVLEKEYISDDGCRYRIALTVIDSGYLPSQVYKFCEKFSGGVMAIKGREASTKTAIFKEFSRFQTNAGTAVYGVNTTLYKDRMASALHKKWDRKSLQDEGAFNMPLDISDDCVSELTAESKQEHVNTDTGEITTRWKRPSGVKNELWDLLIYAAAAIDIIAVTVCEIDLQLEKEVDWVQFWDYIESQKLYFLEK